MPNFLALRARRPEINGFTELWFVRLIVPLMRRGNDGVGYYQDPVTYKTFPSFAGEVLFEDSGKIAKFGTRVYQLLKDIYPKNVTPMLHVVSHPAGERSPDEYICVELPWTAIVEESQIDADQIQLSIGFLSQFKREYLKSDLVKFTFADLDGLTAPCMPFAED
jgi:hypothetical protein